MTPDTWAMTGLPVPDGRSEPAVFVVKIDNTASGRPQVGIDKADLVVEEPVEGGATRVAAFFQSTTPNRVGPVRSIRTSDVGLVKPVSGTLVASGGAPIANDRMAGAGISVTSEGDPGYYRDPSRPAPYNLFVDLKTVRAASDGEPPDQPYLTFGEPPDTGGKQTSRLSVSFTGGNPQSWTYDSKESGWLRDAPAGAGFVADSLVILKVKVRDAGYRDPAGNPVPEVVTKGSGTGRLVTGKRSWSIRWSKSGDSAPWQFTLKPGSSGASGSPDPGPDASPEAGEVAVPAGNTWIALVPESTGSVKVG